MILCVRIRAFAHGAIRQRQVMILYPVYADGCVLGENVFIVSKIRYRNNEKWIGNFSHLLMRTFIK
jgi:hypothetical protein